PIHYLQFAGMGHLYSRLVLGVARPRLGLLSIGEEEGKGPEELRNAFGRLRASGLNFVGNIEGKEIFSGAADVILCDGFTGNVSLKVMESTAEMILEFLVREARGSLRSRIGFLLARPTFRRFRRRIDYAEYGGVPLLGIRGCVVVCHGRSSPRAIQNAARVVADFVRSRVIERIQEEIPALGRQAVPEITLPAPPAVQGIPGGGGES
ncbi:MAG: phosphate--acyl-ACP acyltransferase, partial [Acidobacteria bacterium]|nr:phosphate--acyl-ACP acyltransferase [Acidobacteriota bacterium]